MLKYFHFITLERNCNEADLMMHVSRDDGESGVGGLPDGVGQTGDAIGGFVVVRALHTVLISFKNCYRIRMLYLQNILKLGILAMKRKNEKLTTLSYNEFYVFIDRINFMLPGGIGWRRGCRSGIPRCLRRRSPPSKECCRRRIRTSQAPACCPSRREQGSQWPEIKF